MTPLHIFLILVTAAAWGLNFVTTRIVLEVFSPSQLSLARAVITLVILLPWWQPWRRVSARLLWASFAIGVVSFYLLYLAIDLTDSLTTVAISTQLMAPISAVIALFLYRERITPRKWMGIGVATAGAIMLVGATGLGVSSNALGLTVLSVVFYALGSIVISKTDGVGIWRLLAWISAVSLIPMGLLATVSGPLYPDPATIHAEHWMALMFSAVASSVLGQAVLFSLYRIYPVADVVPYILFVPVFAALFAVLLYHEHVGFSLVFGGAVILLGVWIQQSRKNSAST